MTQVSDAMFIGVDFGGTTISAGAVKDGGLLVLNTVPTLRERTPDEILGTIVGLVTDVSHSSPVAPSA